ncbi:hybrid sensor histidine kinase/response regulator transcription factor [Hymenobacter properus]|uniref:histidine kinase n=1 Tax=Hymenobacter properus TaxID=2791026 RepID=A0A931FL21_9BACT|nr:hybrid sensor histidine kinase/response regulator transcription factor [Hymenobacter properus]MBF9142350.1 response regulator [Hymenobacter properus]MBR7721157.1 response regulator [Microvirga sp. SRT04]
MVRMRWRMLWLSVWLLGAQTAAAQTLALRDYTLDNGLPQSMVYAICQDGQGRLWAGTQGGVCVFDGQKFRTRTTAQGLPDNHVRAVAAGPDGTLWMGHSYGGVSFIRPDGQVRRCRPRGLGIPASVACVWPASRQVVWVGTPGDGLFRLVCGPTDTVVTHYGTAQGLPSRAVHRVAPGPGGRVWVGTGAGLVLLDPRGGPAPVLPPDVQNVSINHVQRMSDTLTWCATANGLLRLSGAGTAAQPWRVRRYGPAEGLCAAPAMRVVQDRGGNVWATTAAGLAQLPAGASRFRCRASRGFLDSNVNNDLLEDREGNIWFVYDDGIAQHPADERFRQYGKPEGLPDNEVTAVQPIGNGRYWIGTRNGIAELNPAAADPSQLAHPVPLRGGADNRYIRSLWRDQRGDLWMSSHREVARYTPATGRWTYFDQALGKASGHVMSMAEDRRGRLWLVTLGYGAFIFDPSTQQFKTLSAKKDGMISDAFWQVFRDHAGGLWLASDDQGLIQVDTEHDTFRRVDGQAGALSLGSISEDPSGQLWLGTIGRGVLRFSPATKKVRAFGPEVGLQSSNPFFVQCDSAGRVWAGTNRGLDCFDPRQQRTVSYGLHEGFLGQETNQNAVYLEGGRQLWVGTMNGLMHYDPARAHANRVAPVPQLTGLRIFLKDTTAAPGMELPARLNYLTFDYIGASLTNPDQVRYQYRLLGFEDDCAGPLTATSATYTNLGPGHYTFEVKAANEAGVWSPQPARFSFSIRPPWWRTWWAYLLYASGFGLMLYGVRAYTKARERDRANRRLEYQALAHLQEMDRVKTDFFTNVSHELRTPLTLILGPAEVLATEPADAAVRQQGGLVLRNARKLLSLINQLLDLSKLEAGALRLLPTSGDAAAAVRQLVASFSSLADSRQIALTCHTPPGPVPLVFDAAKLEEILTNLLANALRFTPPGGTVAVTVAEAPPTAAAVAGSVVIEVRDSGPGIAAEDLPHLFDRFYQASNPAAEHLRTGTGIGLALVRELTALHGGSVAVASEPGAGATFTVQLPRGLRPVAVALGGDAPSPPAVAPVPAAAEELAEEPTPPPAEAEVVLVIEDNDEVREFVRATLAPAGYRVLLAPDGRAGVALAQAEVPDLVVSDVMMPGLNGYQVCEQLKTDPVTSHVPVVLLTAKSEPDAKLEGLETGADAFLAKPFNPRELRAQVRNLLALRQRVRTHFATRPEASPVEAPAVAPTSPAPTVRPASGVAAAEHAAAVAGLPSLDQEFLRRVNDSVLQHLGDENFGVDEMGNDIGMSRTQVHRKLKALTGQSPGEYIRGTRLQRAHALLQARVGTVAEVSYQVGFGSPAAFSTAFSRQFGYPPSAAARQAGEE